MGIYSTFAYIVECGIEIYVLWIQLFQNIIFEVDYIKNNLYLIMLDVQAFATVPTRLNKYLT